MIEVTTPVGRMVGGHPMVSHPQTDNKTNLPKLQKDGVTPVTQTYVGLAIPKGTETHWNQTEWGAQIYNEGVASWPNGETQTPIFSWKITDGDSQIPNKKMKRPCDREGYPGHWIIQAANGFPIKCYHRDHYQQHEVIQQKEAIKCGDYCRLVFTAKSNAPSETPGLYINPSMFELYQAGIEIVSENAADPTATFGAVAGALPAGAMVDPNIAAPHVAANGAPVTPPPVAPGMAPPPPVAPGMAPPPPVAPGMAPPPPVAPPAGDYTNGGGVRTYTIAGVAYTVDQLRAGGYTDAQIAALP